MTWRWPWTSVARLCDAKDQIEWLRTENKELTEALVRLQRFQSGMPETPRPPRREMQPMPAELKEHIDGIGQPAIRREIRDSAFRRSRVETWDAIMADLMKLPAGGEE